MTCLYCGQTLHFTPHKGWHHAHGGGTYVQRCDGCGFRESKSPPATSCPSCGATREWRDDHVATPVRDTEPVP